MAISFVNKSAFASGTAGLTVGAVSATQANDLILLFVESANQAIATPTGYTIVTGAQVSAGTAAAAGGMRLNVFYRWATGADGTVSVADTGDHTTAIKLAYRGVDLTTPFDATPVTGTKTTASTSSSYPGITTASANALVIFSSALDLDAASTTTTSAQANGNITSLTERHDQTVASGLGGGIVLTDGFKAAAGATGNMTATVTSTQQVYITLALRPAPIVSTGDMDATETGSDTFAGSGSVFIEGAFSATETSADTFAGAGPGAVADGVSGSLAASETGNDTFTATGDVIVKGSLAATESGADTFTATGKVIVRGTLATTEAGADTFAANGDVIVRGSLAASEAGADTLAGSGKVLIEGAFSASETGSDTFAATGGGVQVSTGTMAAAETGSDALAGTGAVLVRGALAGLEAGADVFGGNGQIIVKGPLAASETGQDAFASTGNAPVRGMLAATETGSDTFAGNGAGENSGTMAAAEYGADLFASSGAIIVKGALSASEAGGDVFAASGGVAFGVASGDMVAIEAADTFGGYASGYFEPGYVGGVSGTVLVRGAMGAVEAGADVFRARASEYSRPRSSDINRQVQQRPDAPIFDSMRMAATVPHRRGAKIQTTRRG